MEGTMTSTTAVLVGPGDVGGRPQTATVSVAREEIEEALASDDSPELILEVQLRETERREDRAVRRVRNERDEIDAEEAALGTIDLVTGLYDNGVLRQPGYPSQRICDLQIGEVD